MSDTDREAILAACCRDLLAENGKAAHENKIMAETIYALRCELRECRALIKQYIGGEYASKVKADVYFDTPAERRQREAV